MSLSASGGTRTRKLALTQGLLLGIGIGTCVLAFAVTRGVLIQGLPFPNGDRILWFGPPASGPISMSITDYSTFVARNPAFERSAPLVLSTATIRTLSGAERVSVARIGSEFFSVLGIAPVQGRLLQSGEDVIGGPPVVIVSESFVRRLGEWSMNVGIGSPIVLDGRFYEIVGIVASQTAFPSGTEIWLSIEREAGQILRSTSLPYVRAIARVRDGREVDGIISRASFTTFGSATDPSVRIEPIRLRDHLVKDFRPGIVMLGWASAFFLAVACLGAMNLRLASLNYNLRELAVRIALGASSARLWGAAVREAAMIATLAVVIGGSIAVVVLEGAQGAWTQLLPELATVVIDWRVLALCISLAVVTSALATCAPLVLIERYSTIDVLRRTSHAISTSTGVSRLRDTMMVASLATTLLLVTGFIMAAEAFVRLVTTDTGFSQASVQTAAVRLPFQIVTPKEAQQIRAFARAMQTALGGTYENEIALTTDTPGKPHQSVIQVRLESGSRQLQVGMSQVTGNYFRVAGLKMLAGATFQDENDNRFPVIVDRALADAMFPGESPLGRRLDLVDLGVRAEIHGVVEGVRQRGRRVEPLPQVYLAFSQLPLTSFMAMGRGKSPFEFAERIRSAARDIDATAAIGPGASIADLFYEETRRPRFYALSTMLFAVIGLAVSAMAIYASVAAFVAQRTKEIAIRSAMGASRLAIGRQVAARIAALTLAGSILGLAGAFVVSMVLQSRLAVAQSPSLLATAVAVAILWLSASLALVSPVRKAMRISPTVALQD